MSADEHTATPVLDHHRNATLRRAKPTTPRWGRKNPYPATVLHNSVLSGPESDKEVRHLVISLGDSGIEYAPGDGIGVIPINDPMLVERILDRLGATGDEVITTRRDSFSLREALAHRFEIATASKYLVDHLASRIDDPELSAIASAADRGALDAWLRGRDVLDLLNIDPALTISPDELVAELQPLAHRVYSISSSPRTHAGVVHLTMTTVRYHSGDRARGGACSTHLADRCAVGGTVGVFVSPNRGFRPPADEAAAIMIGPGTGIAPFRSFLYERRATGATGRNWLFFGDRRRDCDFLYAEDIGQFVADDTLTRVDLAFSRDQDHKVYVQDRMRAHGAEFFDWIEGGAHVYVCGDAGQMAPDVEAALVEIIAEHGGLDAIAAQEYLDGLKKEKRYLRDVY